MAARILLLADELVAILHACRRHRVPCVPVRGAALAETLHGDCLALRAAGGPAAYALRAGRLAWSATRARV